MTKPLKFLFVPCDAVGCVNPHSGLGQELLRKGHSVAFALPNGFRGKLAPLGFVEKYYQEESLENNSLEKWGEIMQTLTPALSMGPVEKFKHIVPPIYAQLVALAKEADPRLREIIAEVQPDLILTDMMHNPAVSSSEIPWMIVLPLSPLGISVDSVPPAYSGYPITEDKKLWEEFHEMSRKALEPMYAEYSAWVHDNGGPELKHDNRSIWTNASPFGNLYMHPKELGYEAQRPDLQLWHQFDALTRYEPENFEIPAKLASGPGKLIYFSMGTIGCAELGLMRRLIGILAKSPNRFIVSKGPFGDQLELPENMWGANHLPQTNVLPLVDLVITHGGNNSTCETFYFGKRAIVLPLFYDQLDNAQRVQETGLGLRFEPYHVTEQELLDAIEKLLNDDTLEKRMYDIGLRIRSGRNQERAADLLINVAMNNASSNNLQSEQTVLALNV